MNGPGYTQDASRQGRVVVISAGTPGIGADLVRAVAADGAKVAFRGTRPDGGQPLIDELLARFAIRVSRSRIATPRATKWTLSGPGGGRPAAAGRQFNCRRTSLSSHTRGLPAV